jgi:hypothetical protein
MFPGAGHVVLQQPQDVLGLPRGQAHDPVCEPAGEQAPLTGQRMHPHHRWTVSYLVEVNSARRACLALSRLSGGTA